MSASICYRKLPPVINSRLSLLVPKRNGYIVLLPEVNPNIPENSVLMKDNLPDFSNLTTDKCVSTFGKVLLDFEQGVRVTEQAIEKGGCSDVVKEIIDPLEKANAPLDNTWGIVKNLYLTSSKLMPGGTYVPLHHRARKARSAKFYSRPIYNACKECDQENMAEEEQRIVEKFLLEGRLAGLDLEESKREELATVHIKMAECRADFNKRVEVSSKVFHHTITDPSITRDMPDTLLKLMAHDKEDAARGPWKVTLQPTLYELFMAHCPDPDLRWNVWQAKTRVASTALDNTELINSVTLEKIRDFRRIEANLLGYETYAHLSMETKMAGSLENVRQTLGSMLHVAKPIADKEIAQLTQFAWERSFKGNLQIWDIPYWQRKQKRTLFDYQEEHLTDFLPFDKVWSGLLGLCERLFSVKIVENTKADRWHPDVRFFHVYEDSPKPVAGFYLDPYLREDKLVTVGPWVVNITPAARVNKTPPLSTLVLQLEPPIYGKPCLLTWSHTQALFRQFGHMLQQLLSTVNYAEVSGQSNIEWDAVEIVGNVFVHLLKEPSVLESISGHYATKECLPTIPFSDIDKHMAAFQLCQELFKAHLDLELYTTKDFWQDVMKKLWPAHFTVPFDEWDGTPCNFTEIVTQQWAAAYFSHVWARMVAADVYSAFTEPDVDVASIGSRFRDTYLAFGGSCPPGEVFRRFRGRDPSSEAFLKHLGLH